MASKWKDGLAPAPIPSAPKGMRPKGQPKLDRVPRLAGKAVTGPRTLRLPAGGGAAGGGSWYSDDAMSSRDKALSAALADPLAPTTGDQALAFAKSLAQSQSAPVMQEFDRQQGLAESKYQNQSARQQVGTDAIRAVIASQIAGQQASQDKARGQIAGAGQALQASVDQGLQQAQAAGAQDRAVRGAGLDGGGMAAVAADAAAVKARGAAGSQIALDSQASAGAQNDALLNQISAATAQQGGERQGALTAALNSQLRDVNQGRAKAMSDSQEGFVKTLLDLKQQNTQTTLARESLGLQTQKAAADAAQAQADLDYKKKRDRINDRLKRADAADKQKWQLELEKLKNNWRADQQKRQQDFQAGQQDARQDFQAGQQEDRQDFTAGQRAGKPEPLTSQDNRRRAFITDSQTFYDSGELGRLKAKVDAQGKGASAFRQGLANRGIKDPFMRQLLADVAYGGLRADTVKAYRTRYGRNPPPDWKRHKAPKRPKGIASGLGTSVTGTLS